MLRVSSARPPHRRQERPRALLLHPELRLVLALPLLPGRRALPEQPQQLPPALPWLTLRRVRRLLQRRVLRLHRRPVCRARAVLRLRVYHQLPSPRFAAFRLRRFTAPAT